MPSRLANVSVIIPVGPGDGVSPVLWRQLRALPRGTEVIRVFANVAASDDADREAELPDGVSDGPRQKTLVTSPGRATQQNAGAAAAHREWLWFLHADSRFGDATLPALSRFLAGDRDALGFFDLRFLDGPVLMRINTFGAHLRSRWLRMPFGDQGLVLRRDSFNMLGGFNTAVACGEDHDLVWRARRAGVSPRAIGAPLYTSARKYDENGWGATTASHLRETWRQARRFSQAGPSAGDRS